LTKISSRVGLFYDGDDVSRHIDAASTAFGRFKSSNLESMAVALILHCRK